MRSKGTIIEAVDQVLKFIQRNTRMSSHVHSIHRQDIPEYPEVALREVLVNALVHADYSLSGRIQRAIFDNRLEIQNPGILPFGLTLDDFKAGVSRIRNRVIARVFRELELMEEWCSGYNRVITNCNTFGYLQPQWEEIGSTIRVSFPPHPVFKDYSEQNVPVNVLTNVPVNVHLNKRQIWFLEGLYRGKNF